MQIQTPIPQYAPKREDMSVIWENFGDGSNRRLNTYDKKEVILHEEFGRRKVIEEYVEDKSTGRKPNDSGSFPNLSDSGIQPRLNSVENMIGSMNQLMNFNPQTGQMKTSQSIVLPN